MPTSRLCGLVLIAVAARPCSSDLERVTSSRRTGSSGDVGGEGPDAPDGGELEDPRRGQADEHAHPERGADARRRGDRPGNQGAEREQDSGCDIEGGAGPSEGLLRKDGQAQTHALDPYSNFGTTPEITSHRVTALRRLDLRHETRGKITSHHVTALRRLDLRHASPLCGLGTGSGTPHASLHAGRGRVAPRRSGSPRPQRRVPKPLRSRERTA